MAETEKTPQRKRAEYEFLERQLAKQAETRALAEMQAKNLHPPVVLDPYDPYWSQLSTLQVQILNKLRIENGLASPKTKAKETSKRIAKPAKPTYREEWQDKVYG